jgi:hypothetical protein
VHGGYRGYLPSFVGFAPADRPALVGLVAIAEPQGGEYYGAQVAAPAFSAITRQVLLYRGIHPQRDRPAVWMGETVLAGLPAKTATTPSSVLEADALADGDEHEPVAIDPAPAANPPIKLPGDRSHAPL